MKGSVINFILFIGLALICLSDAGPQWTGTFKIDGSCVEADCCCLTGIVTVTQLNNTDLLVSGNVAGAPCQAQLNGSTAISVPLPVPQEKDGYQLTTFFLGSHSRFTLSQDNQYIVDVNYDAPKCSDSAKRTDGGKGAASSVSPTSFILLISALLLYVFLK